MHDAARVCVLDDLGDRADEAQAVENRQTRVVLAHEVFERHRDRVVVEYERRAVAGI